MANFDYTSQLSTMKPYTNKFTQFMSQLTDEQLAEAGLEIMNRKKTGKISNEDSIIHKLQEWICKEGDFNRPGFDACDVEKYVTDEIMVRFSNKVLNVYHYANIKIGDEIWYFNEKLKDIGEKPEKGTVLYITYDNGKIDIIGVAFDDSADEFWVDDKTFGNYLFLSREAITTKFGI